MRTRLSIVLLALAASAGGVRAQDAGPTETPTSAPAATAPAEQPKPDAKKLLQPISPNEMSRQANELIHKMQQILKRVVQLQEITRRGRDVIRLNCVNDKLLQVKQLLNIAEGATTNLQEAIAREDEEGRYHEFGRVTIAHQQVQVLAGEAENCIGEDLTFLGPTEIIVEGGDEPDDPTVSPEPDFPFVDPAPVASPFI